MFQSVLLAAICACLLFAGKSEACSVCKDDLSWSALQPRGQELPLNGKIYSRQNIQILNNNGEEIETLVQEGIVKYDYLSAYEPKRGFEAGEKITIQRIDEPRKSFTVTISSTVDEEAPPAPVLSHGAKSEEIKIAGEGLFYIIEGEHGPIGATRTFYKGYGQPHSLRANAVDEAGNRSLPSNWITAYGDYPDCVTESGKVLPSPAGCSSTASDSILGLLLVLSIRRARFIR